MYDSFDSIREDRQTFEDRIGGPDECTSALGHIIIGFSWLEASVAQHLRALAGLTPTVDGIITAGTPFTTRVKALSGLVMSDPPLRTYNLGYETLGQAWDDMNRMLNECGELRDAVLNTHWGLPRDGGLGPAVGAAGSGDGVRVFDEVLDSGYILDIYDFFLGTEYALNEFFLEP